MKSLEKNLQVFQKFGTFAAIITNVNYVCLDFDSFFNKTMLHVN